MLIRTLESYERLERRLIRELAEVVPNDYSREFCLGIHRRVFEGRSVTNHVVLETPEDELNRHVVLDLPEEELNHV